MAHKIAVIGSTSFSGSHLIASALRRGLEVIGISRSDEPPLALRPYAWEPGIEQPRMLRLDLNSDLDALDTLLRVEKPQWIVNFAAQGMVGESWKMPAHWFQTNTLAQVCLHERLRSYDFLDRYLHISTPEVYGSVQGIVNESAPYNPSSPYAVSKAAADMSLMTYFRQYGFPVLFTRSANVYGPGQQLYRVVPRAILALLFGRTFQLQGGGTVIRSFVHIDDVTSACWAVLERGQPGEVYHVGPTEQITICALFEQIAELMGVDPERSRVMTPGRTGEDAAYRLDTTKIRQALGWRDCISLTDGLSSCIEWARRWEDPLSTLPDTYVHRA